MMTLWIPENLTTSQNIVFFLRGRQQVNGELTSVLWELLADLGHKLRDVHPCTVYMVGRGSHYICCCFNGTLSVRGKGQYVRDLPGSCSMVPFPFSFKIIVSHQRSAAAKAWIHYSPNTSFVSVLQFFWYPALFFPAFFFYPSLLVSLGSFYCHILTLRDSFISWMQSTNENVRDVHFCYNVSDL